VFSKYNSAYKTSGLTKSTFGLNNKFILTVSTSWYWTTNYSDFSCFKERNFVVLHWTSLNIEWSKKSYFTVL